MLLPLRALIKQVVARRLQDTLWKSPLDAPAKPRQDTPVSESVFANFHQPVAEWFLTTLGKPTRAQILGWPPIQRGESTLLLAPTGSGKTLAAFLGAVERIMWSPRPGPLERCRVVYVSPLKALAVDVERNLQTPITGIAAFAASHASPIHMPQVDVRTGDTPPRDRARMRRHPPDILITTPESLYLMLTSDARNMFASVRTVIIDEIHALASSKRGSHLFLSIERLEALRQTQSPLQRIGLSATQRPLDEIARLLGGYSSDGAPRPVTIVDVGERKVLDLSVEVPDVDMAQTGQVDAMSPDPLGIAPKRFSVWPHIHERIVQLIRQHRTTMVFVNSRRIAERSAAALNDLAGEQVALAHHGSVAHQKREQIEARLKGGDIPALVATSSLELGIDMGSVDLVIQVEAPASVASGMQRVGRACHGVRGIPRGILIAKHRGDLLACAAAVQSMRAMEVEETVYPRNPLDVLAQQVVAIVAQGPVRADRLFGLVRRAAPYADLPRVAFDGVLDMLSGRYPTDDFSELHPRITWDRMEGLIEARHGAKRVAVTNAGTIPDKGLYGVFLPGPDGSSSGGMRVGELDEEMVFELRTGEVFLLGASSWRADTITQDRVIVSPAPGQPGKMPFWHGDRPGRTFEFGKRIGQLAQRISRMDPDQAEQMLREEMHLGVSAAHSLVVYVTQQVQAVGDVPSDQTVVVERQIDEMGDWRVCVLTPFGLAVHAPWAIAVRHGLETKFGSADMHYTDDGMVFRIPACDHPPEASLFFPSADEIQPQLTNVLAETSLYAARFRECAARALLLPRRGPRRRTPLWAQRRRAGDLLSAASQYPSFPIVLEAFRECLRDVFDLPNLRNLLRDIAARTVRVVTADARAPSPFAANVLFAYVANFIYLLDPPVAERNAQALTIDHAQLRDLLGETELRQLLDPALIADHVRWLQRLSRPVKSADAVHDLLLQVGDLSRQEIADRAPPGEGTEILIDGWLQSLQQSRRIISVSIAGQSRVAAAEDAGRLRTALNIEVPLDLPTEFLAPVAAPVDDIVARYARTHGPFRISELIDRFGLSMVVATDAIVRLSLRDKIVQGAFLPGGVGVEYCDSNVLAALRSRSLARFRRQVEPVDEEAYARFLLDWQGIARRRRGQDALVSAVAQLEGYPLAASVFESDILPARVDNFHAWEVDALLASGDLGWVGVESLGPADGRISLCLAEHEAAFLAAPRTTDGNLAAQIRELLSRRGAMFFREIQRELGGFPQELVNTLWEMVWAGEVINDTLEPLRSRLRDHDREAHHSRSFSRHPTSGPAGSEGRWSLRSGRWSAEQTDTLRAMALARALLDRYGVVTRDVALAEGIAGGFSALYPVFRSLEEAGRVRRGYFISGRGGVQFALPGADDRLRSCRDPANETQPAQILSAVDPANPYGALLAWPSREEHDTGGRPQRTAGAHVLLHDGRLLAYLARGSHSLLSWLPEQQPDLDHAAVALTSALARWTDARSRKVILLSSIDGAHPTKTRLLPYFLRAGFSVSAHGLMKRHELAPNET